MAVPLSHRRALYASAGTALAILAAAAVQSAASAAAARPAAVVPATLSATPLGVNVAPWDYAYFAPASVATMQPLIKAAGIRQLRYGGGTFADAFDWQTNTTIENCLPYDATASFTTSTCASAVPLSFSQFSKQARAIGASSFVTVNYGSGTPAEAAAWVKAAQNPAKAVALWEVGNEGYGCWEVNNELAGAPEKFQGYLPGVHNANGENPTCPMVTQGIAAGMQTMATSYAVNAKQFIIAMKKASTTAAIGVPWAFGNTAPGASVAGSAEWNRIVLGTDGQYLSFVDAHFYPFGFSGATGGSNPTNKQVLQSLFSIPSLYGGIRGALNVYAPQASVVVGETGVSNHATMTACTPVGAVFTAGDILSWRAAGAKSVDWWDLNNYGDTSSRCLSPDQALFTSSAKPVAETPYYGYLLAAMLAQPHAKLAAVNTSDPADVLGYRSVLPNGKSVVALINTNTSAVKGLKFQAKLSGTLLTWRYSAGNQNAANSKIVTWKDYGSTVARGIVLPAESITIYKTS
jgi:hypothetical protein